MRDKHLILYVGRFCPLCDEAMELIYEVLPAGLPLREVVIDDDHTLTSSYGVRIPVLAVADGEGAVLAEKGWPFSLGQVRRMLAEQGLL